MKHESQQIVTLPKCVHKVYQNKSCLVSSRRSEQNLNLITRSVLSLINTSKTTWKKRKNYTHINPMHSEAVVDYSLSALLTRHEPRAAMNNALKLKNESET